MPETIAPTAPAAPAAPSTPTGGAALGQVPVGFGNVPASPAFQRASKALDKFAGVEEPKKPESPKPDAPKPDDKPNDVKALTDQPDKPAETQPTDDKPAQITDDQKPKEGEKPKRPNPWKMLDEERAKRTAIEREYTEFKSKASATKDTPIDDHPRVKELSERLSAVEKERDDLKEQNKFAKYEESDEYKTQFQQPYFDAWNSGRAWVSRLKVIDPNGNERPGKAEDFDRVVDLSFQNPEQAEAMLQEMFGGRASTVAAYIADVQKAGQKAANAIEEFRKTGAEKQKIQTEAAQRAEKEITDSLGKFWGEANKYANEHPKYGKYFKQVEGDQEWNQRLGKGYELAKRAFAEDPKAPNLTAEQRKSIVQRHAAAFNRIAAFGALAYRVEQLEAKLAERDEALAAYEDSEPGSGDANGKPSPSSVPQGGTALERAFAGLNSGKYNRP